MTEYDLYGGSPPSVNQDTSIEAAASIASSCESLREQIFDEILYSGNDGHTDDEIEVLLKVRHQTASARRRELVQQKRVVDSGIRRLTRSNRRAIVWVDAKINDPDGQINYEEYLDSDAWKAFKEAYYLNHERACYVTGETQDIELHHKTYIRLGKEIEDDVVPLSRSVHKMVHVLHKQCHVPLHECHEVVKTVLDSANELW